MSNFDECLQIILHHEGGYVNHPKDPGGETNLGVTKRVYEEHGGTKDMKDLEFEDVAPIYKKSYWDRVKTMNFLLVLTFAFLISVLTLELVEQSKYLQTMIGTVADGGINPKYSEST